MRIEKITDETALAVMDLLDEREYVRFEHPIQYGEVAMTVLKRQYPDHMDIVAVAIKGSEASIVGDVNSPVWVALYVVNNAL